MGDTADALKTSADSAARPAHQLVIGTFGLYRRYPLLFFVLAAAVIVPYEVIVLVVTGSGPFAQSSLSFGAGLLLMLVQWALIGPLVSALHVHAVAEVREGQHPRLAPVARQGLRVLPVVAAASIISWLGISLGLVALLVPGIYLMLRWFVVAQAAAIEHEGWLPALRSSNRLTGGHYGHIFVFIIYLFLIVSVPTFLIGFGFGHDSTDPASFLVGVIVEVFAHSFAALATALFYFDLRIRHEARVALSLPDRPAPTGSESPQVSHSWDPRTYSDQDRPKGWYIDPSSPDRMRYWGAGEPPDWQGSTRTPRKISQAWRAED